MSQPRQFTKRKESSEGFTLIEVLVSLIVLAIGLLGVAALISSTVQMGTRARYMSMANVLASEKLDSLDQWPSKEISGGAVQVDDNIAPGGALSTTPCASGDQYCDMVTVNEASGADYETQTVMVDGSPTQETIVHTNTGCVDTPANCGVPNAPAGGGATFTRRWLITWDPNITGPGGGPIGAVGVRRITVLVTLNDGTFNPPLTFQMSTVRP